MLKIFHLSVRAESRTIPVLKIGFDSAQPDNDDKLNI